jgi:hypothetical protein
VHVPLQLHDELVVQPAAEAKKATDQVKLLKDAIADVERASAPDATRVAAMKSRLNVLEAEAAIKVRAEQQRGDQFTVMRNDVFHTNVATDAASARLQAKGISPTAVEQFKQRAAAASTPEQVELLERELHP